MKSKQIKLAREQLDETLKKLLPLKLINIPAKGWIRAIRDTLGMTGEQLANRLGTNKQRISRIENDEIDGKITLNTLRNVAKAMDCEFVYGFVPRESLKQTVLKQASLVALKHISRSNQMMRLEKQELSNTEKEKALETLIKDIIDIMPKSLWEKL